MHTQYSPISNHTSISYTMSSLMRLITLLCFLTLSSFLQSVVCSLYSVCSINDNFTTNDPYATNSKELVTYLRYQMNPKKGFVLGSKGQGLSKIHGLALCGIGVSAEDCNTCFNDSTSEIQQYCPYSKVSIMWYENCFFKYSNDNFFGRIDDQNTFYLPGAATNASWPATFESRKIEMLSNV